MHDDEHDKRRERGAHDLQGEVPGAWLEVVHINLAKRHVEHNEDYHRQQLHKLGTGKSANGFEKRYLRKEQIDDASHGKCHEQCPLFYECK